MKVTIYNTERYGMPDYRMEGVVKEMSLDQLKSEIEKAKENKNCYAQMVQASDRVTISVGDGEDLFFDADIKNKDLNQEIADFLEVTYH